MDVVNISLLGAALVHVFEEYGYPGGFSRYLKQRVPPLADYVTPGFSVTINGLLLTACSVAASPFGTPHLRQSLASLFAINALFHIVGTVQTRRYVPGVVTAVLLYLPLSSVVLSRAMHDAANPVTTLMQVLAAGVALQLVPVLTLVMSAALDRR